MTFVAMSELRSRQMTTVLGNLWHLVNPALSIAIYYVIFGLLLKVDRGVDNYILFLTVGVLLFSDIQRATGSGAGAIAGNKGLLKSLTFPRALLPVTSTITEALATLPSLLVIYAVALITGASPRWTWPLLLVVVAGQFLMNVGLSLFAARAASRFADVRQILPFLFRLLMYGSGVIFSVEAYATGRWAWAFEGNPIYGFISLGRWAILGGPFRFVWLVCCSAWTVLLVTVGFVWFRRAEHQYGRE
jgi:teichoic acid transport system permease protein